MILLLTHDHKRGVARGKPAFEPVGLSFQQHQVAALGFEVDQQPSTRNKLIIPRPGNPAHGAGGDDPVIRGVLGPALGTVPDSELGMTANCGQPPAGGGEQFWVDVHRKDVVIAQTMGQQGGVVAAARSDLQDPLTITDVEGFEMRTMRSGLVEDDIPTWLPYLFGMAVVTTVVVE